MIQKFGHFCFELVVLFQFVGIWHLIISIHNVPIIAILGSGMESARIFISMIRFLRIIASDWALVGKM